MQIRRVQNTVIPWKGMCKCHTLMRKVGVMRTERKWSRKLDVYKCGWQISTCTDWLQPDSCLRGENCSEAWFYFQEKQQVINLYLIIETNGLTSSQAEHNLKYWLRHRIFLPGLWLLWNLQSPVLKPQGVSSETRLCLKFLMFTFQPPQSQDLRPARLCSTCQKNCQGLCWGPRRHESKIRRSCTNLQAQPLSLGTHIRHSQYTKLQEIALLKIRVAATLGVPTSLISSLPPKDLHPGVGMAKPYMKLVLNCCSLHTEWLRQNKASMIHWVGKCCPSRPCFTEFCRPSWNNGNPGLYLLRI